MRYNSYIIHIQTYRHFNVFYENVKEKIDSSTPSVCKSCQCIVICYSNNDIYNYNKNNNDDDNNNIINVNKNYKYRQHWRLLLFQLRYTST